MNLSPLPVQKFFGNNGRPLVGGKLFTYAAGTTTKVATWRDSSGLIPNTNPIILDFRGECQIWLDPAVVYKFTLAPPFDTDPPTNPIWTVDNISPTATPVYPRTAAEIAAGVIPTNYTYEPGDFFRYGLSLAGPPAANSLAINNALSSNSNCFCNVAGTYQVNSSLNVQSNQTIRLAQGVVIQGAAAVAWGATGIFDIEGRSNVRILGGVIDGNKAANPTGTVFGVRMRDCSNVSLYGVTAINCPGSAASGINGGDGFYVGGGTATGSVDIDLIGCVGDGNVRQGLSLVKGSRMQIVGCSFINTTGTAPGAGIDLEANNIGDTLRDIAIVGCTMANNQQGIAITTASTNVAVTGCTFRGNRAQAVFFGDCTSAVVSGNAIASGITVDGSAVVDVSGATEITISDNRIIGNQTALERSGIRVQSGNRIRISNNTVKTTNTQGVVIGTSSQSASFTDITVTDNSFFNCVAAGTASVAVLNITGNTGAGFYPQMVSMFDNTVYDNRGGGSEADFAISINTGIPAATISTYRVERNRVNGPALAFPAGTLPPLCGSVAWNPANIASGTGETSPNITVTGAAIGDSVDVFPPYDLQGLTMTGYVSATNTVVIRIQNGTGGAVDLANGTWSVRVKKLLQL